MADNDDILARIDDALQGTAGDDFGEDYWRGVDNRPVSCGNCGYPIESAATSTGWTHIGDWQGVRCPNRLCGATPATP